MKQSCTHRIRSRKPPRAPRPVPEPTVSEQTIARLVQDACSDHRFGDLTYDEIVQWVNYAMKQFLKKNNYPWWYGHLDIDKPKQTRPRTEAQILAFEKVRARRASPKVGAQ